MHRRSPPSHALTRPGVAGSPAKPAEQSDLTRVKCILHNALTGQVHDTHFRLFALCWVSAHKYAIRSALHLEVLPQGAVFPLCMASMHARSGILLNACSPVAHHTGAAAAG